MGGVRSAVVGRKSPVLCAGGLLFSVCLQKMTPFITFASFDIAPSPRRQINQCTQLASGLRPHPGRGGNANGGRRECGGGSEQPGSACRRGDFFPCKMTHLLSSPHLTPPPLRTGESMHLVSFWPSSTPRARRERQRGRRGVRWWVGTARFCVQEGCFFRCKRTHLLSSPHLTPPRLRTGESMHLVSFWPSSTPKARRERQRGRRGVRWWVGTARFCVQEGCFFPV
jgi:hypothetical protein